MAIDRSTPPIASLYRDLILEHYKRPRNKGELDAPDRAIHMRNPTCGDEIKLELRLRDGRIEDARFSGTGCSISQASASMMTDRVKGRTVEDALHLVERFTAMMHGDEDAARDKDLGDLRALGGVSKFPVRVKCALLGFDALASALGEGSGGG